MASAWKTVCTVIVTLILFSQVHMYHSYMPSRQTEISRDLSNLAWANKGTAFIGDEQWTIEGQRIHDVCFVKMLDEIEEAHPNGRTRATVSAAAYLACYGNAIEKWPGSLCDQESKAHYLTRLSAYFGERAADIEQDRRWKQLSPTSSAHVYVMMSGYAKSSDSNDPSDFDVDSRIVFHLNHLVELGLLSRKADLAPIMDVAILSENPSDQQSAAAHKTTCE
jgi:hypothetical protein